MKKPQYSAKRIAVLSILTALCYVGRIVFQFLPNVQPMTAVLLILSLNLGLGESLLVATLSLLLSNLFLGMGPWTLPQLVTFFFIIFLTATTMKRLYHKAHPVLFGVYAFVIGMVYGFIISLMTYRTWGMTAFWPYYLYGLPFDFLHAAGTAGFYLLLEPILEKLLKKLY